MMATPSRVHDATDAGHTAVHLPGGNYFDDMRLDISRSHAALAGLPRTLQPIRKSRVRNVLRLFFTRLTLRLNLHEWLVASGIRKQWLEEFQGYWCQILKGRPLWTALEFFLLTHDYRKRQQHTRPLEWSGPRQHIEQWQHPGQLYSTFQQVRKCALQPIVSAGLWKFVAPRTRILEYGCSLAPYYNCYREFYSHLDCNWLLADLPNYPFHYARYRYRNDAGVEFVVIDQTNFSDPLGGATTFDVVILTTVLEHVDDPLFVAEYLLDRLKPGGLFVFDYVKSAGIGLDHPRSVEMRDSALTAILGRTDLIMGRLQDISDGVGLCVARKRDGLGARS